MSILSRVVRCFAGAVLATALSCSSNQIANSPASIEAALRERWIAAYRAARAGAKDACATFTALAREPKFPAAPLAELRANQSCAEPPFSLARAELPPYLRDLGLDVALGVARARGDRASEMELAAEVARRPLPQRERIELLRLARRRARELNLPVKVAQFEALLYQVAPRLNPAPLPKEYLAVAADFRQAREFGPALRYYEKVINGDARVEDKVLALQGIRRAHKNARRLADHLKAAHRVSAFLTRRRALVGRAPRLRAMAYEALTYEARALWTAGRPAEAARLFARLELQLRGRQSLADVYLMRARMAEESRDYAEVARYLELALGEKPGDALRDKVLWYAAWNERGRGNAAGVAQKLRDLDQGTRDESARVRALYWLGHTLRADARTARDADPVFERVIALDPLGYYGLLAHRQLGRVIQLKRARAGGRRVIAPTLDAGLADWLVALDEREPLALLLDDAAAAYLTRDDQDDDAWTDLLQGYARAGLYLKLFEGLQNLPAERRRAVLDAHPDLLFPRPWPEITTAAAAKAGVEDALIYALMRQESAFDPRARSGADAFGLMQLLPEVAERLAKTNGSPYARPEDLFEPATIIPLGASFLRELSDRYHGQLILVTAAYNASDAAIAGWVRHRYRGDALAFIEEIPYEETRTYVRLVLRNLVFYRLLTSTEGGLKFPEETLLLTPPEGV